MAKTLEAAHFDLKAAAAGLSEVYVCEAFTEVSPKGSTSSVRSTLARQVSALRIMLGQTTFPGIAELRAASEALRITITAAQSDKTLDQGDVSRAKSLLDELDKALADVVAAAQTVESGGASK